MPRSSRPDRADRADRSDPAACERQAVGLLARREHTRVELERKLAARGYDRNLIDSTLDRLEQSGLLDGQRFVESFVESRASKGFGPLRIRAELMQRGITSAAAAEAVGAAARDWAAMAAQARVKRFGAGRPPHFEERARQARFLEYRGFRSSDIDAALELGDDSD